MQTGRNPSLHHLPTLQHSPSAGCPSAARESNPPRPLAIDRTSPSELLRPGLLQRDGAKETYEERVTCYRTARCPTQVRGALATGNSLDVSVRYNPCWADSGAANLRAQLEL